MSQRKNIAFLIPGLGVIDRGAEHAVLELSIRLSKNFDITIFSRATKKELKKYKNIHVYTVWAISRDNPVTNFIYNIHPKLSYFFDILSLSPAEIEMLSFTLLALPYLLFKNIDLLFPVNGFWGVLACRLIRNIRGIPFVYASHGGEEPRIARQNPNIYIALTVYTKKWLERFNPFLKVVYIPNGVDTDRFSPKNKPVKLNLERPIFLTVAALIPSKRVHLAILAVAQLKKGSLLILGEGSLQEKLISMGVKLLGKNRFDLRKVSYTDMPGYYRAVNVFTLPSFEDPSPLAYLEALASNLKIVAPIDHRRKSILGEAAFYCRVENTGEYAKALFKVARINMDTRQQDLAKKFSWEVIEKKYATIFKKMLE